MKKISAILALGSALLCTTGIAGVGPKVNFQGHRSFAKAFEENAGQWASDYAFRIRVDALEAGIAKDGSLALFSGSPGRPPIRVQPIGAERVSGRGIGLQAGRAHYIRSSAEDSVTDVRRYASVSFEGLYPGISARYHADRETLEFDFVVAAGTDPAVIKLAIRDADSIQLKSSGDLAISVNDAVFVQRQPRAYQIVDATRVEIPAAYKVDGNTISFTLGSYDPARELVIDPVVEYASYLGGSASDEPRSVRIGQDGSIYVAGRTTSSNFPRVAAFDTSLGGVTDVFVTKINPATGQIVYSTYIGGTNDDEATGLAVDYTGAVYITGNAGSRYPTTTGAYQTGTAAAGFVTKLSVAGSALTYSTLVLGTTPLAIEVDSSGQAIVTGKAGTSFTRTAGALQSTFGGAGSAFDPTREGDAFALKLNATGAGAVFATYLGGAQNDYGRGIAIDSSGRIVIGGYAESTTLPMVRAFQAAGPGGFIAALAPSGTSIVYSTYFGGSIAAVSADPYGNIVAAGSSYTASLPMVNPVLGPGQLVQAGAGVNKPFIAKFRLGTNLELAFSTFTGSALDCCESPFGVAVDGVGDIHVLVNVTIQYLSYLTQKSPFLPTSYVVNKNAGANSDVLVAAGYAREGGRLLYQSIVAPCGEAVSCRPPAIHAKGAGSVAIAGTTASNWLQIAAHNHQAAQSGTSNDGFVMTFNSENAPLALEPSTPSSAAGQSVDLVARSNTAGASGTVSFLDGSTVIGTAALTEGIARFTASFPAGISRLSATLGATQSPTVLLPVELGVCP